jgi:perosamine synthetase
MSTLALLGGTPVIGHPLPLYNRIGAAEMEAVKDVLQTGVLSGFVGAWGPEFGGGPAVQELERLTAEATGARHVVSVNSATSGLFAAMAAIGIGPGDEVIVPPTTMSATVMAPLAYGGIPVFVDIEENQFCLDADLVEAAITERTRAILVVNLFGHPAQLARLREIADARGIYLIEDNAQSPLATEYDRFAGTIGHIGVFSLNRHKHIQCGEGGLCTTDDERLAHKLMAVRNHGENVIAALGLEGEPNMVGQNYRLSELCAAVGVVQMRGAREIIDERIALAEAVTAAFAGLDGISPPEIRQGCTHAFYVWAGRFDADRVGCSRAAFAAALCAEGMPVRGGYLAPLYNLPLFRDRTGIGRDGWPLNLSEQSYVPGLCPVAERMHEEELLEFHPCAWDPAPDTVAQFAKAVHKVYENRHALADWRPATANTGD